MSESVVDLNRTGGILNTQTLQSASDRFELTFDQYLIATMQVTATDHRLPELLPFGGALQYFGGWRQAADGTQQLCFDRLQLFKMIQLLLAQRLKFKLQYLRQLTGNLLRFGRVGRGWQDFSHGSAAQGLQNFRQCVGGSAGTGRSEGRS